MFVLTTANDKAKRFSKGRFNFSLLLTFHLIRRERRESRAKNGGIGEIFNHVGMQIRGITFFRINCLAPLSLSSSLTLSLSLSVSFTFTPPHSHSLSHFFSFFDSYSLTHFFHSLSLFRSLSLLFSFFRPCLRVLLWYIERWGHERGCTNRSQKLFALSASPRPPVPRPFSLLFKFPLRYFFHSGKENVFVVCNKKILFFISRKTTNISMSENRCFLCSASTCLKECPNACGTWACDKQHLQVSILLYFLKRPSFLVLLP